MAIFREANQVRLALKMKLSQHAWYKGSVVQPKSDGYCVVIIVSKIDNNVRKLVAPVVDGISVRAEVAKNVRR